MLMEIISQCQNNPHINHSYYYFNEINCGLTIILNLENVQRLLDHVI